MNTVGRKGRLGGEIRCVVSVSMLTEGWDANTVTHILGLRAFGTKLICEQVIGRALRRLSYDPDPETGLFPRRIRRHHGHRRPQLLRPGRPGRRRRPRARPSTSTPSPAARRWRSPSPASRATASSSPTNASSPTSRSSSPTSSTPTRSAPPRSPCPASSARPRPSPSSTSRAMRRSTLVFRLATHLLSHTLRDADERPKLHLFPQAQAIVSQWLNSGLLVCKGGTFPAQLAYRQLSDEVCDLLVGAINTGHDRRRDRPRHARPLQPRRLHRRRQLHHRPDRPLAAPPRPLPGQLDHPRRQLGGPARPGDREPPPRRRLRQEPQPRPRDPLRPRRRAPPLPPRLPRPPRATARPSSSRSRASATTPPRSRPPPSATSGSPPSTASAASAPGPSPSSATPSPWPTSSTA